MSDGWNAVLKLSGPGERAREKQWGKSAASMREDDGLENAEQHGGMQRKKRRWSASQVQAARGGKGERRKGGELCLGAAHKCSSMSIPNGSVVL